MLDGDASIIRKNFYLFLFKYLAKVYLIIYIYTILNKELQMGYTNYYRTREQHDGKFPIEFVNGVKAIVANSPCRIVGWDNESETEPTITENKICLNGYMNDGYETFSIEPINGFYFCKTARCGYDVVVKAILLYAERHFNILRQKFGFDGNRAESEFRKAVRLLKKLNLY